MNSPSPARQHSTPCVQGAQQRFEREFFSLAMWMLGCNLRVMGGDVLNCNIPKYDLSWSLLGMMDFSTYQVS